MTVPSRPTKGAVAPTVARNGRPPASLALIVSCERWSEPCIQSCASMLSPILPCSSSALSASSTTWRQAPFLSSLVAPSRQLAARQKALRQDRRSVVSGQWVAGREDQGGGR